MYYYKIFDLLIGSDLELPQLLTLNSKEEQKPVQIMIHEEPFPTQYIRNKECYSYIHKDICYLSNSTCYLLIQNGNEIIYEKKQNANLNYLVTYILGWGMSMLAFERQALAIHCSCVANQSGAVLICGESGCGKSTVTSFLLEHGYSFMADDMTIVNLEPNRTATASYAFPYQKLCRDVIIEKNIDMERCIYINEEKDKFLVPFKGTFIDHTVPIRCMILLSKSSQSEVLCKELTGINKMYACMHSLFLKPLFGQELFQPQNGASCLKMASSIPIYHISRPASANTKAEVLRKIQSLLFEE